MLKFDKATYLSFLFEFILSERLSNNLWGSDVLLILISFSKFSDVFPAFTYASAVSNLWRSFSTIPTILFGFLFPGIYFLIITFLKSININIIF